VGAGWSEGESCDDAEALAVLLREGATDAVGAAVLPRAVAEALSQPARVEPGEAVRGVVKLALCEGGAGGRAEAEVEAVLVARAEREGALSLEALALPVALPLAGPEAAAAGVRAGLPLWLAARELSGEGLALALVLALVVLCPPGRGEMLGVGEGLGVRVKEGGGARKVTLTTTDTVVAPVNVMST
jgi:hypothetical protein